MISDNLCGEGGNADEADDMDLDAALADLDIDKDFGMSFLDANTKEENISNPPSHEKTTEVAAKPKQESSKLQVNLHHQLYERDEIFSRHYNPSKIESEELREVAAELQVKQRNSKKTLNLLFNIEPHQNNILLKRGKIFVTNEKEQKQDEEARLIFLVTHGFVVAKEQPKLSGMFENFLSSSAPSIEHAHFFLDVEWIKDLWQLETVSDPSSVHDSEKGDDHKAPVSKHAFLIHVKGEDNDLRFNCESLEEKQSWLAAWERVLLQSRSMSSSHAHSTGWQHEIVQTSLYTAAVTGRDFYAHYYIEKVNVLDEYNKLAPLHYAVIHNQVHVIQHLVEKFRADVELLDDDGRTPMYYAERDDMKLAMEALTEAGAKPSKAFDREQHGALVEEAREFELAKKEEAANKKKAELFKGATKTCNENEQLSPKQTDHHSAAKKATSQMHEAMAGIIKRGKKIEDLGDKADELEQNTAQYADLAGQMKAKMKKKNKGLNFLNPFSK